MRMILTDVTSITHRTFLCRFLWLGRSTFPGHLQREIAMIWVLYFTLPVSSVILCLSCEPLSSWMITCGSVLPDSFWLCVCPTKDYALYLLAWRLHMDEVMRDSLQKSLKGFYKRVNLWPQLHPANPHNKHHCTQIYQPISMSFP